MPKICSIPNCGKPSAKRGWCGMHYRRWRLHGDPNTKLQNQSRRGELRAWLIAHRDFDGEQCLIWPFGRTTNGRGSIWIEGRNTSAHLVMCELVNGPKPSPQHEGSHICGNGHLGCVHPRHVIWETHKDNLLRTLEHGTATRGTRNGMSKLTATEVRQIRKLYAQGHTQSVLAEKFGVFFSTVSKIVNNQTWRWLTD